LLDFVRSRLPTPELAFLSVCHTALMKDRSVADEALHLTSAVQHCRVRSNCGHGRPGPRRALLHASISAQRVRGGASAMKKRASGELFKLRSGFDGLP
ncbi:hypothetical protein EDB84DRAFT_1529958, partial [Lactarius hengduanensis]